MFTATMTVDLCFRVFDLLNHRKYRLVNTQAQFSYTTGPQSGCILRLNMPYICAIVCVRVVLIYTESDYCGTQGLLN